jgi:hypothetical protein
LLNPDYRDILSIFNAQRVEYLLVGAYALAVHGLLRATGDIDLWVRRSEENSQRIMRSLADFGAPRSELSAEDLETPDLVFQIGLVPRRIDILTSITGVGFEEAWEEREEVEVEGMMIPVISRRHLIVNKRSVGRLKDLADANWLEGKIE